MKKIIVLIALFVFVNNYSQEYTLLHINSSWNARNDYKDLNKIKGARIVTALLEDQSPSIRSQITSVPVIFLYKNSSVIGRWDGGISLQIKVPYTEIQNKLNDSKINYRRKTTD